MQFFFNIVFIAGKEVFFCLEQGWSEYGAFLIQKMYFFYTGQLILNGRKNEKYSLA